MDSLLSLVQIFFAAIAVMIAFTYFAHKRPGVLLKALAYGAGSLVSFLLDDWIPLVAGLGAAILINVLRIDK